jgi:exodeoxyribonuclease-5
MLTEVHRQARDNPIIALAQTCAKAAARNGRYGESRVIGRETSTADKVLAPIRCSVAASRRASSTTAASAP